MSRGRTIFKECGVNISLGSSRTSQGHYDTLVLPCFSMVFPMFLSFFWHSQRFLHEFVAQKPSETAADLEQRPHPAVGPRSMGTSWRCRYRQAVKACEWGHPKELAGSYGEVAESSWLMMLRMLRMLRKRRWFCCFLGDRSSE